ncbi:hypothetical protein T459_35736 [Capsicum annuum]|uniref:RNase H type-1 domain-containing protein n=1 Tax=Capsicum annuum TaxID=4072 RepID=A0A2G2UZW7_CAPAN|nr:hypothetical protein T459_35736 [Capsicum annuum]
MTKHQFQKNVFYFIKVCFPRIKQVPFHWDGMLYTLQVYKPRIHYLMVQWDNPDEGWVRCNMDGASKVKPRMSSYEFCIRDSKGNLIDGKAHNIGFNNNMEAESIATLKALVYYLSQNLLHIHLETDYLGIINMIRGV